jgi:hypothetical protein
MSLTMYEKFLINELKRYHKENNKVPCARDMCAPYPSVQAYRNHFTSWNNALKIAGFKPRKVRVEKIVTRPIRRKDNKFVNIGGYICPRTLADIME